MSSLALDSSHTAASALTLAQSLTQPSGSTSRTTSAATSATTAASSGTGTATSTSTSTGDITSNDFLTLLVTEMKNQDPTQPTDPNAYIQQLVGVNSLQQLISINQELGAAGGSGSSSATSSLLNTPAVGS